MPFRPPKTSQTRGSRIFKQEAIIRADFLLSFSILEYLYSYCVLLFWHYFITTFSNESSNKDIPNYIAGYFDRSGILDIEYFSKNSHSQSIDARAFYLIPFNSKFSKERPHRAPMNLYSYPHPRSGATATLTGQIFGVYFGFRGKKWVFDL